MSKPRIAVISFPGTNNEIESLRALKRNGMNPFFFRWNDDTAKLQGADGYFLVGGFSYEDRGRAGMVSARDPLMDHIAKEASEGKVVIGNCNGAQMLIETGLVPLNGNVRMSLARNVVNNKAVGFRNEWVWITPSCSQERCATSDWSGAMHLPIAHGEGRFTTKDKDLIQELKSNNQIAFRYCDAEGNPSLDPLYTPNGSSYAIAGICNPQGNVVALMPHPERTTNGDPYFASMRMWIESKKNCTFALEITDGVSAPISVRSKELVLEIFIDTLIVNNEERTVEQAARRVHNSLSLRQFNYIGLPTDDPASVLSMISMFNPNKEVAYLRRGDKFTKWNADVKSEEQVEPILNATTVLRRDIPDTGSAILADGAETGVCYVCTGVSESDLQNTKLQEVFGNIHASTLELV